MPAPMLRTLLRSGCLLLAPLPALAQTVADQVVEQVNIARWDNGQLPPLKQNAQLHASSLLHSTNMAVRNFFMHCDPDTGTSHGARMNSAGYSGASMSAENIAVGYSTAAQVMTGWMNSSGHRANILRTSAVELGVGYFNQPNDAANIRTASSGGCTPNGTLGSAMRHYWTQNFGARPGVSPLVIAREAYRTTACNVDLYMYGAGFATQMRFSNDGSSWSAWQAYAPDALWSLSGASGSTATVFGQIRNGGGSVRAAQDSIVLGTTCTTTIPNPDLLFEDGFD